MPRHSPRHDRDAIPLLSALRPRRWAGTSGCAAIAAS